jgi:glycosyltransferase involved in cell wall biosynthesis
MKQLVEETNKLNDIKFSIVVPVYNGEKFLKKTIESIKSQTFKNYEVIIVDGNSIDNTMAIVNQNKDIFFKIISETDNGMYDAINKGFKYATGTHYCYLNSDDLYKENTLMEVALKFKKTNSDLVFGDIEYIDENDSVIYSLKGTYLSKRAISYIRRVPFAQQSSFWSVKAYESVGGFDDTLNYVSDSKFLLQLLLSESIKYSYINKILASFRFHPDSFSIGSNSKMKLEGIRMRNQLSMLRTNIIFRYYYEFFTKIFNLRGIIKKKRYSGLKL